MQWNRRIVASASSILLASIGVCAADGYFTEEALKRLTRVGMPTQEIVQVFGRPLRIRPRSDGQADWSYLRDGDASVSRDETSWLYGFTVVVSNAALIECLPMYATQHGFPQNGHIRMQIPDLENGDRPLSARIKEIRVSHIPTPIPEQDRSQLSQLLTQMLELAGDKGDVALERGWDFTKCVLAAFPELEKDAGQSTSRAISLKRTVLVVRSVLLINEPPSQLPRSPK